MSSPSSPLPGSPCCCPPVQKVRNTSRAHAMYHNLKQLGRGLVHAATQNLQHAAPAGASNNEWDGLSPRTAPSQGQHRRLLLLPAALHRAGRPVLRPRWQRPHEYNGKAGHGLTSLPAGFLLPLRTARRRASTGLGNPAGHDATWAISNYRLQLPGLGNPAANNQEGHSSIPRTFVDGTSNTVILGDALRPGTAARRHRACGPLQQPVAAADLLRHRQRRHRLRPLPAVPGPAPGRQRQWRLVGRDRRLTVAPWLPPWATPACALISGSISATTWANACDPRDGNVLGEDW